MTAPNTEKKLNLVSQSNQLLHESPSQVHFAPEIPIFYIVTPRESPSNLCLKVRLWMLAALQDNWLWEERLSIPQWASFVSCIQPQTAFPHQRNTSKEFKKDNSTKLIFQPSLSHDSEMTILLELREQRWSTLKFECLTASNFKKQVEGFNQFRDTRPIFVSNRFHWESCLSGGFIWTLNLECKIQFEIAIEFIVRLETLLSFFRENSHNVTLSSRWKRWVTSPFASSHILACARTILHFNSFLSL
jgi:hypothetical protein